jgi:hypothetical protein
MSVVVHVKKNLYYADTNLVYFQADMNNMFSLNFIALSMFVKKRGLNEQ